MTLYFVIYCSDHCSPHCHFDHNNIIFRVSDVISQSLFFFKIVLLYVTFTHTAYLFLHDDVVMWWPADDSSPGDNNMHKCGDGPTQCWDKQPQRVALLWFVYIQQWWLHWIKVSGSRVDKPLKQPIRGWPGSMLHLLHELVELMPLNHMRFSAGSSRNGKCR